MDTGHDHVHDNHDAEELIYDADGHARLHLSCITDTARPTFDAEWQRRAFGLAVALSEFRHYDWSEFQQQLIGTIGRWEDAPPDERGRWIYYQHWVEALSALVDRHGMLDDGYVNPGDQHHPEPSSEPVARHAQARDQ